MSLWPKQSPTEMNTFYGNPDLNHDLTPDAAWESANLIRITPPYQLYYPSDDGGTVVKRATKFKSLVIHKKCADSLLRVLTGIKAKFTPADIESYELDICGGTYNFRLKRGGTSLSIHSWAAAIDLSHLINRYNKSYDPARGMMPSGVVALFQAEGWTWGGRWTTPDAMHFQAADL